MDLGNATEDANANSAVRKSKLPQKAENKCHRKTSTPMRFYQLFSTFFLRKLSDELILRIPIPSLMILASSGIQVSVLWYKCIADSLQLYKYCTSCSRKGFAQGMCFCPMGLPNHRCSTKLIIFCY